MKGHEEFFSKIFKDKMNLLINLFSLIFKNNIDIAKEYVDSYVFDNLYESIMNKLNFFYLKEQNDLKKNLEENLDKYEIESLEIEPVFKKCQFIEVNDCLNNLKNFKTSFEKTKYLIEVNSIIIEEAKATYENDTGKKFVPQGNDLLSLWLFVIAHCNNPSQLLIESLFFKYFQINKGFEENDYITNNFVCAMGILKKELVDNYNNNYGLGNNDFRPPTIPVKVTSFS